MKPPPVRMEVSRQELDAVLARGRERLEEPDYEKLKAAIETLAYLTDLVQDKAISLARLREILLGAGAEKTGQVTPAPPNTATGRQGEAKSDAAKARPGHGRHEPKARLGR